MKQAFFFLGAWFLIFCSVPAQTCLPGTFRHPRHEVIVDSNIVYGSALNFVLDTVELKMDLFQPTGDTLDRHPLIIWIHGGGFYAGAKEGIHFLCDSFARRGYITASISYRLGFYREFDPVLGEFQYPYCHDPAELYRAVFRATQDARGAIRYLKGMADQYQIDTSQVFIGGESAGAFTALHVAFWDKPHEMLPDTDSIVNVIRKDLFGNVLFNASRPDLGSLEGHLNLNGTSAKVTGVINIYGALLDTSLIESPEDPALFQYHILQDPVVSCGTAKAFHQSASLLFPFTPVNAPLVFGACRIRDKVDTIGFCPSRSKTYLRNPDLLGNPQILPHSLAWPERIFLVDTLAAFLDHLICPGCDNSAFAAQSSSLIAHPGDTVLLNFSPVGECMSFSWEKDGQTLFGFADTFLIINHLTASDTGIYRATITSLCGTEYSQEIRVSLQSATAIDPIKSIQKLRIYPNPADDYLNIVFEGIVGPPSSTVMICDLTGRPWLNRQINPDHPIDIQPLPPGIYLLRLESDGKIWNRKFVIQK